MYRKEDTNIAMSVINGKDLEQAKIDLINFVGQFDGDLNGDNGPEYTFDSALELGYNSSIEYIVGESLTTDIASLIKEVLNKCAETYYNYEYVDWNYEDLPNGDFMVAFTSHN